MTDTSALIAFIRARLDEDETAARAATPGRWVVSPWGRDVVYAPDWRPEGFSSGQQVADTRPADGGMGPFAADLSGSGFPEGNARHIARHDPARVLREVALKRRHLEAHRPLPLVDPDGKERPDWPERECRKCGGSWMGTPSWAQGPDFVPPEPEYCEELRHLALVYSDHPDYRPEWLA